MFCSSDSKNDDGDSDVLCFTWEKHGEYLAQGLWRQVSEGDVGLTDAGLQCGPNEDGDDRRRRIHRAVLSLFSPKFKGLQTERKKRPQNSLAEEEDVIVLDGNSVSGEDLDLLLEWMYLGRMRVSRERLPRLLQAAETIGIERPFMDTQWSTAATLGSSRGDDHTGTGSERPRRQRRLRRKTPQTERKILKEKPFVCDECGHATRRKDNLKKHVLNVHERKRTGHSAAQRLQEDSDSNIDCSSDEEQVENQRLTQKNNQGQQQAPPNFSLIPSASPPAEALPTQYDNALDDDRGQTTPAASTHIILLLEEFQETNTISQ